MRKLYGKKLTASEIKCYANQIKQKASRIPTISNYLVIEYSKVPGLKDINIGSLEEIARELKTPFLMFNKEGYLEVKPEKQHTNIESNTNFNRPT